MVSDVCMLRCCACVVSTQNVHVVPSQGQVCCSKGPKASCTSIEHSLQEDGSAVEVVAGPRSHHNGQGQHCYADDTGNHSLLQKILTPVAVCMPSNACEVGTIRNLMGDEGICPMGISVWVAMRNKHGQHKEAALLFEGTCTCSPPCIRCVKILFNTRNNATHDRIKRLATYKDFKHSIPDKAAAMPPIVTDTLIQ